MAKDDRLEVKTHELSHRLLGNIISDLVLAIVDPRIRFK